jgi:hypothetical protein
LLLWLLSGSRRRGDDGEDAGVKPVDTTWHRGRGSVEELARGGGGAGTLGSQTLRRHLKEEEGRAARVLGADVEWGIGVKLTDVCDRAPP